MNDKRFNKKIFAMLIEKAKGDRTTRQFANDCKISYVQLHKLEMCGQQNPPGLKLIKKLAENSVGNVSYDDFVFSAGLDANPDNSKGDKKASRYNIQPLYEKLSVGQQKTVYDFIDYLLNYKK